MFGAHYFGQPYFGQGPSSVVEAGPVEGDQGKTIPSIPIRPVMESLRAVQVTQLDVKRVETEARSGARYQKALMRRRSQWGRRKR